MSIKKLFSILLFAAFIVAPMAHVFAEELVPPAPTIAPSSSEEIKGMISNISEEMKRLNGKNGIPGVKDQMSGFKAEMSSLSGSMNELAKSLVGAVNSNTDRVNQVMDYVSVEFKNVSNQIVKNTWVVIILMAIGFTFIAILIRRSRRYSGGGVTATDLKNTTVALGTVIEDAKKEIVKAVKDSQAEIQKTVKTTADETVKKIKTLDPFTFTIISRGHTVTCTPAIDGGAYRSFHVSSTIMDTPDPSKIDRQPTSSQGRLRRNTQSLMDDYFDGKFDVAGVAQQTQKNLLEYLKTTPEMQIA